MLRFGGENGFVKEKHIQVQEGVQGLLPVSVIPVDNLDPDTINRTIRDILSPKAYVVDVSDECGKEAWDRPQPRESSYQRGKLLEAICTLLKGSYWTDAGPSSDVERKVDKTGVKGS